MKSIMQNEKENYLFYLFNIQNDDEWSWHSVLSIKGVDQIVINPLIIDKKGKYVSKFDLQGLKIVSPNLSWDPFINLLNCNEKGFECQDIGLLVDLMNVWAQELNFTWTSYRDINNDWGLFPKSGKFLNQNLKETEATEAIM